MAAPVNPRRVYNMALRHEQARATRRRVLDAARHLFAARGYHTVTIRDVAAEAGVAVQTVNAIFGTKLALAKGIVEVVIEEVAHDLPAFIQRAEAAHDVAVGLRVLAAIARHVWERTADVHRFLREAGDPDLAAEARRLDTFRYEGQAPVAPALQAAGRLPAGMSTEDAADLVWALTSSEWFDLLVRSRGWSPAKYETHLAEALVRVLLERGPF